MKKYTVEDLLGLTWSNPMENVYYINSEIQGQQCNNVRYNKLTNGLIENSFHPVSLILELLNNGSWKEYEPTNKLKIVDNYPIY